MTESELQEVVAAVIQSLKTNGKTISQLTEVTTLADTDYIELSSGRKVSYETFKGAIADEVEVTTNQIKGYVVITSTSDLPETPTADEQMIGYLLGTVLYVYVGEDGDTLDGLYQSVQMKGEDGAQGPAGADGADGANGVSLGDVVLVDDLTTGGSDAALSAEQGKVLKGIADSVSAVTTNLTDTSEYKTVTVNWAYQRRKINLDGTTSDFYAVCTSSPIELKAGQEIKVTFTSKMFSGVAEVVMSLTDANSSSYTPVVSVNYTGGTVFIYKAKTDCYIAISGPMSNSTVSATVGICGAYGSTIISQRYNLSMTNVGNAIDGLSSYLLPYEVPIEWDSHENKCYRPNGGVYATGYTYHKAVGKISRIRAILPGDNNNFTLMFFDAAGHIIESVSHKYSVQTTVDVAVPSGAADIAMYNSVELAPVGIALVEEKLALDDLEGLYSAFLRDGYRQLTTADMMTYTGHIVASTGDIVYYGDAGYIVTGKVNDIVEIVFSSVGYTGWSSIAYYDENFTPISVAAAHSGTKTIVSTVPSGAVYYACSSRVQYNTFPVYVKESESKYDSFVEDTQNRLPKNVVGNPYRVVAEAQEARSFMGDAAIKGNMTTKYVSPSGNDSNTGTSSSPVKTIAKALELAQGSDCNIELADGTYRISSDLTVSNTGYTTKIYSKTGDAVIKGSSVLSSPTDEGDGIVSYTYAGNSLLHEIFVDDEVRFPASAGNDVPSETVEATFSSQSGTNLTNGYQEFKFVLGASDVAKLANYVNVGYVTFYRDWRSIVGVIKAVDTTNNTVSIYVAPTHKDNTVEQYYGGPKKLVIKNINETLDCYQVDSVSQVSLRAGSFFHDITNSKIYYKLADGETAADITVEVPLSVTITLNSPCTFNNIKFSQFGGTLFNSEDYTGVCIDHQGGYCMDGTIKVYGEHSCFYKCEFSGFTLHCIKFYNGSSEGSVLNSYFHNLGCGAVMIGERDDTAVNVPTNVRVIRNVVKMTGQCLPESCAFVMTFGDGCEFSYNTISYSTYSAFNIGYVWKRDTEATGLKDCIVKGNDISNVGHLWLEDLGGIYTLGDTQGMHICGNFIHDIHSTDKNRNGIYLDEGTKNAYVYNNVSTVGHNHSHWNRLNYIYNNVFSGQYYINNYTIDLVLSGNIFYGFGKKSNGSRENQVEIDAKAQANIVGNLYWGDGCANLIANSSMTETTEKSPYVADPNFTDFGADDFTIYDTEHMDSIGFQSFQFAPGAKGVDGEGETFEWFTY